MLMNIHIFPVLQSLHISIEEMKVDIKFLKNEVRDIKISINFAPQGTEVRAQLVANMNM